MNMDSTMDADPLDEILNADPLHEIFDLQKDGELCDPFQANSPDNSEDPLMKLWIYGIQADS